MTLLETINSISAVISSFRDVIIIIVLIWGVRYIGRAINRLAKNIPDYLDKWEMIRRRETILRSAKEKFN